MVIGSSGRVETANELAFALFGKQIHGQHYIAALRQPRLLSLIEESFVSPDKKQGAYTATIERKTVRYTVHTAPVENGVLVTFVDTTEAQELDVFRREFVANVSHELRTPLASVLGFVETLRGHAKDDAGARERFLEIIERETKRMSSLVDDLLSLSRVEEDERKRPTTPATINTLIKRSITELEPIVSNANSVVSLSDASLDAQAYVDADQLHQVMINLIENALRYGRPAAPVAVHLAEPSFDPQLRTMAIRISIANEGEGIASHHLPRLTERFYRVDSHRSREIGGTGLGLAIVKHIIQRHRGRLEIESALGKGSTFTVILPVFEEKRALS